MESNNQKKGEYRVRALERALDILECFSFQDRELNLSEVVKKTGLNKTTAKRLISNLTDRGYLKQNDSKQYQLGVQLFELGGIVYSSFNLREVASNHMSNIKKETGATVLLGVMLEDQLGLVDKRDGAGAIQISAGIGWRGPLHYGMLGMSLMAHLDPVEVKRLLKNQKLEAHTPASITDEGAFSLRLEQIRNNGYVIEHEEAIEGIVGIAAPIRDYSRKVIAALGIILTNDQTRNGVNGFIELVKETCDKISADMGYLKI